MSFKMDCTQVITTFVEAMLPRFSAINKVLYIPLELTVTKDPLSPDGIGVRKCVHLLFHRPGNYTKVLWNVTKNHMDREGFEKWDVKSDHDSCWRSDGLESPLFKLYIEMCEEIAPSARPIDLQAKMSFALFKHPEVVEVKSLAHDRENFSARIQWK